MAQTVSPAGDLGPARILAVIGSPRSRGNTYRATQAFEEQVRSICGATFEYLFLADLDLGLCKGCGACLSVGEERCPLQDNIKDIEQRLLSADGLVFACPVYIDNMPWLIKNFLDRLAYANHRPRFFDQITMLLVVSGGISPNATISRLAAVRHCGFRVVHSLGIAAPPIMKMADTLRTHEERIRRAAQVFCDALQGRGVPAPSLEDLVTFRAKQALISTLPDVYKADYRYWGEQGWLDPRRRYYIDTPISRVKEAIARWMVGRMKRTFLAQAKPTTGVPSDEK